MTDLLIFRLLLTSITSADRKLSRFGLVFGFRCHKSECVRLVSTPAVLEVSSCILLLEFHAKNLKFWSDYRFSPLKFHVYSFWNQWLELFVMFEVILLQNLLKKGQNSQLGCRGFQGKLQVSYTSLWCCSRLCC